MADLTCGGNGSTASEVIEKINSNSADIAQNTLNIEHNNIDIEQNSIDIGLNTTDISNKVSRTGDTMTGDLEMGSNSVNGVNQCTAWAKIKNGVLIASYNIASIAVGSSSTRHKVTFSTPMNNGDYIVNITGQRDTSGDNSIWIGSIAKSTTLSINDFEYVVAKSTTAFLDVNISGIAFIQIFGGK